MRFMAGEEQIGEAHKWNLYYGFQPRKTFTYSFDHTPAPPEGADKAGYSVYTTDIDVNAPPTDEEIITSNVATAEVALTH